MKVLITGSKGQLGREMGEKLIELGYEVALFSKEELDISNEIQVEQTMKDVRPQIVINCGAYTKVDDCEVNYDLAYSINVIGPRNLSRACNELSIPIVHFSTDFVFNGDKNTPYFEFDPPQPQSVYGQTKLAGEEAIKRETKAYFIVRTSWLYGKYGNNFVKTMIQLSRKRSFVEVVNDQIGSPTCVEDLIEAVVKLIQTSCYGTYHFSNKGCCSWHEFAQEIFNRIDLNIENKEIGSMQLNRLAKRPSYSVLDTRMIEVELDIEIRPWQEALSEFLEKNNL